MPNRPACNKDGPNWMRDPDLWLCLRGRVCLPNGLVDKSAGAGVVPVLRGPAADLLGLFTTHRHGTASRGTGRPTQTPPLGGIPFQRFAQVGGIIC